MAKMKPVTVSPKYQITIPVEICQQMFIKPGMKLQVVSYDDRIVLVPVRSIKEARGSLKGINTDVPRVGL